MKRVLQLAATLLIGIWLMWLASGFSSRGVLYDSVHSMGQRFGSVLPTGYDPTNFLPSQQALRSNTSIRFSHPDRPPAHMYGRIREQERAEQARALRFRLIVWGAVSGCVVVVLGSLAWTARDTGRGGGVIAAGLVRAGVLVALVGVLCVVGFAQARAFWAGVDDALIERSSRMMSGSGGSGTVRVLADGTLDMSVGAFWALLGATVLTALPMMVVVSSLAMRSARAGGRPGILGGRGAGVLRELCAHCARMEMGWVWATGRLALLVYGLVVVGLWSAPWSITIVRALLRS